MHSRNSTLSVLAASIIGATITCNDGEAKPGAALEAKEHEPGGAGGPNARGPGWELAEGAGGTAPEGTPDVEPDAPAAPPAGCPDEMVLVEGQHCYYNEQVCLRWDDPSGRPERRVCGKFKEPTRCTSRSHPMRFCMDRDEYVEPGGRMPVAGASWIEARETCHDLGKRLCTNLEWEFACEGEEGVPYPYGFERSPSLCNQDRLVRDGEDKARGDLRETPHPSCVSPFGIRDMVGNVDEWVVRPYEKPPHRSELRGGWWMTGRNRCRAATDSHAEHYAGRQTGFRCCMDVPDGS